MVTGAVALAEFAHIVAEKYPVTVALHTDHCPKDKLDTYVRPLLAISQKRVAEGKNPLFQSHMWDGSAVPIDENLAIAKELLKQAAAAKIILEIEIGVVGGEEDGVEAEINEKLYTTPGGLREDHRGTGRGRARQVPAGRDVRQRARRLQAGQRQAAPRHPRAGPEGGSGQTRTAGRLKAVRLRLPRRLRLAEVGDRGGAALRRGQDERRHRHPVRVHPAGRRPHVHQLRRRAEDRRRGGQQEGLRPAQLHEEGRVRHVASGWSRRATTCTAQAGRCPASAAPSCSAPGRSSIARRGTEGRSCGSTAFAARRP